MYQFETKCIQSGYKPENGQPRTLPIYQSTTYKYDDAEALGKLFDLIVADAGRKILVKFQVAAGFAAIVNDAAIQMRTHQADGVAVFGGREGKGGAHHAGTDDGNGFHALTSFPEYATIIENPGGEVN